MTPPDTLSLDQIDDDPTPVADPGTAWHPSVWHERYDEKYDTDGNLRDLDDSDATAHLEKPEREHEIDGRRPVEIGISLAAEDSEHSPDGSV